MAQAQASQGRSQRVSEASAEPRGMERSWMSQDTAGMARAWAGLLTEEMPCVWETVRKPAWWGQTNQRKYQWRFCWVGFR